MPRGRQATTESKKESFRRYLETAGVIDTLTKVLVQLYEEPEKPNHAIECVARAARAAPEPREPPAPGVPRRRSNGRRSRSSGEGSGAPRV